MGHNLCPYCPASTALNEKARGTVGLLQARSQRLGPRWSPDHLGASAGMAAAATTGASGCPILKSSQREYRDLANHMTVSHFVGARPSTSPLKERHRGKRGSRFNQI